MLSCESILVAAAVTHPVAAVAHPVATVALQLLNNCMAAAVATALQFLNNCMVAVAAALQMVKN